ncbi:hypothetical protein NEUTE2DRAFT_69729 [Neurospora tetrasperma FGSC 2509]|nr:hypothetical protein NEUTE2DRAFT_69729 [Neurospora tetrasperma FGSC 2509]
MTVSPGSCICSTPSPAPFLSFQKAFPIPFGPGRYRPGLPFRWMRFDALSGPHQKDPSFDVKLRLKLALAGFTSEVQDSVGLPAPERQGDKARGRQLGRVACCVSLVRPGEVMPVPLVGLTRQWEGGSEPGPEHGPWQGKEEGVNLKTSFCYQPCKTERGVPKHAHGLNPRSNLAHGGNGDAMPCHAMLCYAMLCDSMPANRSDRQQYDWRHRTGSGILCFFEPDSFQKFSKVPVSQSRFLGDSVWDISSAGTSSWPVELRASTPSDATAGTD